MIFFHLAFLALSRFWVSTGWFTMAGWSLWGRGTPNHRPLVSFFKTPLTFPSPSSPFSFTHNSEIAIKLNSATANTKRRCRIACTWQGLVGLEDGAWTPEQGWPLWEKVGAALTTVPLQAKTKPISKVCGASEKTCLWKGRKQWRQRKQRREQKKRVRNTRGNTKAKGEEMLHGRADNPKRTAAHGGPMPEQRERVRKKAAERNCYVTNINPPCHLLPEWRDWVLTVVITSKEERSQEWRTEAEPRNGGGRMFP